MSLPILPVNYSQPLTESTDVTYTVSVAECMKREASSVPVLALYFCYCVWSFHLYGVFCLSTAGCVPFYKPPVSDTLCASGERAVALDPFLSGSWSPYFLEIAMSISPNKFRWEQT